MLEWEFPKTDQPLAELYTVQSKVGTHPMPSVADVYRALNNMRDEGIVETYAVCGGTAALFYAVETLRTFDIDIFVVIEQKGILIDLHSIYDWARARAYKIEGEHIYVLGVPIQVLDAGIGIELDAVRNPNILDYDGVPVPVIKPEYIVTIYAKVGGRNRITRALDILDEVDLDQELIDQIVEKHNLQEPWAILQSKR